MHNKKHEWAKVAIEEVDEVPTKEQPEFLTAARALPAFLYQTGLLNAYLRYRKKNPEINRILKEHIIRTFPHLANKDLTVEIPNLGVGDYYFLLEECLGLASQLKLYAELSFGD